MSGPGSVSQAMANGMNSSGRLQVNPAELVGSQFVSQFYTVLHSSPNYLYRFYTDESTVTHADGGSETEPPSSVTVATQRHISERVQAMGFQEATTEIWSVDSQYSKDNGVMVLVTGSLQCKGKKKRDFVQSFFLAVQEKGYFVLNDTFRYLSVNHSRQSQAPKENGYHQGPYDKPYLQSPYQQNYYPTQAQAHNPPQAAPSIYSSHSATPAYPTSLPSSAQTAPPPRADLSRGHAVTPSILPSSRQVPQPPKPVGPSPQPQPPQPAAGATPPEAPAAQANLPEAKQVDAGANQPASTAAPAEKPKAEVASKPVPTQAEIAPPPKPVIKQEAKDTKPERAAPKAEEAPVKESAPSAPLTYAERLKLGARSAAPKPTSAPTPIAPPSSNPVRAAAAPKAVATKAEPKVEVVMDAPEPSTTAANGSVTPLPEESLVTSIFVRQLPDGVTQEKLEEAFARFGSIKNVSLRQQPKGKGDFAFVEFEEVAAMQAAIEAKVIIDGRTVTVMERKPMLPKHPRAQFQGERVGRGEARGEGRGFRPGRDNRGRGRGEGRPFTGGRSERAEGREGGSSGGRGGRSFSSNFSGEARIEGSKPSFEGRPDGGRGRGEGRGRGRNSNRAPQSAPPQPRAEQA